MFIDLDPQAILNNETIQEYKIEKSNVTLSCLLNASKRYELPPSILLAIMSKENGKPGQEVKNTNGSIDHGNVQINTIWVKELEKKYKVPKEIIRDNGCYNVMAGAYILKTNIIQAKNDFWTGVGNYHINIKYNPKRHIDYRNDVAKKAVVYQKWLDSYLLALNNIKPEKM